MQTRKAGCLAQLGIAAVIIFLLLIAAAIWVWANWEWLMREASAQVVEHTSATILEEMHYPEDEQQEMMASVRQLTEHIRSEEFRIEEAEALINNEHTLPAEQVIFTQGVAYRYLPQVQYDEQQQQEVDKQISRFQRALLAQQVSNETLREIGKRVMRRVPAPGEMPQLSDLKQQLTKDEIDATVRLMREAADRADIPDTHVEIDESEVLQRAIDASLNPTTSPLPEPDQQAPAEAEPEPGPQEEEELVL